MRISSFFVKTITAALLASPIIACSMEGTSDESALSGNGSDAGSSGDCTLTQGYWKNHPDAWPVSSVTLGAKTYTKVELIAILKTPVKGNGLVQLAHQLIAAKLNIAAGAPDVEIKAVIQQADALIGSLVCPPLGDGELQTKLTAELTAELDAFNNGKVGPGHCDKNDHDDDGDCDHDDDGDGHCDTPVCGDGAKEGAEACDDGNTVNCDGCSATCTVEEHTCACGNGVLEVGETCDDGNTVNGDGCSATCAIELPVCGNGVVETGETCDDGNTANGDGCSSVCICEPCH